MNFGSYKVLTGYYQWLMMFSQKLVVEDVCPGRLMYNCVEHGVCIRFIKKSSCRVDFRHFYWFFSFLCIIVSWSSIWLSIMIIIVILVFVQIVGAFWYLLSVEREDACWHSACNKNSTACDANFLYCGNEHLDGYDKWRSFSEQVQSFCSPADNNANFSFGIYSQSLKSGVVESKNFMSKLAFCFWWGLQNLRYCFSAIPSLWF